MDIKKIAEGLGLDIFVVDDTGVWIKQWTDERDLESFIFDPLNNWNDTGLVLEALVKTFNEPDSCIKITDKEFEICFVRGSISWNFDGFTLQQAICEAYLATLE